MNNFTPLCPHLELNSSLTGHTRASNFRTSHCTLNKLHKENVKTLCCGQGAREETEMSLCRLQPGARIEAEALNQQYDMTRQNCGLQ